MWGPIFKYENSEAYNLFSFSISQTLLDAIEGFDRCNPKSSLYIMNIHCVYNQKILIYHIVLASYIRVCIKENLLFWRENVSRILPLQVSAKLQMWQYFVAFIFAITFV